MKSTTLILSVLIVLSSCKFSSNSANFNENIDQTVRSEINDLNKTLISGIANNDVALVKNVMSKQLLDSIDISGLISQLSEVVLDTSYIILDEFHTFISKTGTNHTIFPEIDEGKSYFVYYTALNTEMYISLIIPNGGGKDQYLFTNIYGKYPEGWRINIMQFGQYTLDGMNAQEHYNVAKEKYDKGYLMDAVNSISLCGLIAKPANQFFQYQNDKEMQEFYEKVIGEANEKYMLPYELNEVSTKPLILGVAPFGTVDGYLPLIQYLSPIDLKDTISLKKENDEIQSMIGKIFPGIDMEKEYIIYKAYNEIPDGQNLVETYGFVQDLKK